ncbi:hypothetical protein N3K66_002512 [Trichothecium roseum]|uniref:Uncharacterized protein n=1 Tax=Trichothecium roseum TaxID=47278 RepID=A0ACC0V9S3_9HYPO|nr:hypothetical protein N3K66_002512 [Trichothecium roseum]
MPPKKNAKEPAPSAAGTVQAGTTTGASVPATPPQTKPAAAAPVVVSPSSRLDQQLLRVKDYYVSQTPQRTKLLDAFLLFLAVTGGLQLLYCILAGNYPYNAFLSGFGACVGQFVLTVSLRIQTTEANKSDFPKVSPERAFADYIVCSLVLHFFCVNFIN